MRLLKAPVMHAVTLDLDEETIPETQQVKCEEMKKVVKSVDILTHALEVNKTNDILFL